MDFLHRFWWPLFAFLYPLVVWPFGASHTGVVLAKHYFTLLFLLGASSTTPCRPKPPWGPR